MSTVSRSRVLASLSWSRLGLASLSTTSPPAQGIPTLLFGVLFRDDASMLKDETLGFSTRSLDLAADELGLSRACAGAIKPAEIVHEFNARKLVELGARLNAMGPASSMHDGLMRGVRERLVILDDYRATWAGALAAVADVSELKRSLRHAEALTSTLLEYADDTPAADMTWYTKRMLLGGIIGAAEVQLAGGDGTIEDIVSWADGTIAKLLV